MAKKKKDNDICPVCKQLMEVVYRGFSKSPFVDGKKYHAMCHCCSSVPKMYHYDKKKEALVIYQEVSPSRLNTVEDMLEEGWNKFESAISIKAVKKIIRT